MRPAGGGRRSDVLQGMRRQVGRCRMARGPERAGAGGLRAEFGTGARSFLRRAHRTRDRMVFRSAVRLRCVVLAGRADSACMRGVGGARRYPGRGTARESRLAGIDGKAAAAVITATSTK